MIESFKFNRRDLTKQQETWMNKVRSMKARRDGLDPKEDSDYIEVYFGQLMIGYRVDHMVIVLDDCGELGGYLWGSNGNIVDLYVPLGLRRKGFGTAMVKKYLEEYGDKVEKITASFYVACVVPEDNPEFFNFFNGLGFTVNVTHCVFSSTTLRATATKLAEEGFHRRRVDAAELSHVDFCKDYVAIDGRYTLEELESLIIVARREMGNVV